jgi:glycosyltransferase involved in cell wall biosynthesis
MREQADVFLFPSLHDQAPTAVVEAMASGLRVVCVSRGAAPLLIGSAGQAIAAEAGADEAAVELAAELVRQAEIGRQSPEEATARASHFLLDAVADRLRSVLEERTEPSRDNERAPSFPIEETFS